jgi:hypothetical protein
MIRYQRVGFHAVIFLLAATTTWAEQQGQHDQPDTAQEIRELRRTVLQLQAEVDALKSQMKASHASTTQVTPSSEQPLQSGPQGQPDAAAQAGGQKASGGTLDFLRNTTINVGLDGYYAYNFNAPVGRVNLLRAYDMLSNNFSLNQANLIIENAPDVQAGRRWGARFDLQFGQATDSSQGNPANEPRPQVYRNVFQAYGTYIIPLGKGIPIDFGKWASSLGVEGNYTKDQMNYSRSYWFTFLPFYHMGFRGSYQIIDKFRVNFWVVNGTNQAEATKAFKDQMYGFTATPTKTLSWTINYHRGQENPDRVPAENCGPVPVQPGLCFAGIRPAPNGRTHILDSYATWQATPKLTLQIEGDYFIQRLWKDSAPGQSSTPLHVVGVASYAQYRFNPKIAVAARAEYFSDPDGLFSGIRQALKETTLTFDYNVASNFLMRYEWRRDFSNQPTFLTSTPNVLSKNQDTATLGLIWSFGGKEGAW